MKMTLNILGERLQMLRKDLDLSQKDLAATLEVNQNQVSRFENGKGGSIEFLLDLLNYYKEHFYLGTMFSDEFEVIKKSDALPQLSTYSSIAAERLKLLKTEVDDQITDIIGIIEKDGAY